MQERFGRSRLGMALGLVVVLAATLFLGFASESSAQRRTITWMTHLDPYSPKPEPREEAERLIIEAFKEAHPDIDIVVQTKGWIELGPAVVAAALAGNPPDLYTFNLYWWGQHMQARVPQSLQRFIASEGLDLSQLVSPELLMQNGELYAVFRYIIPTALYYRKDLFTAAGLEPPKTWEDLIEAGKKLTKDTTGDGRTDQWGFGFTGSAAEAGFFYPYVSMIAGFGGQVFDDNWNGRWNSPEGQQSMQLMVDMVNTHKITPPDITAFAYDDITRGFELGTFAMIVEGSHRYARIARALGADNVGLAYIPGPTPDRPSPSMFTGWTLAIPRGARNADAAFQFLKFYASPQAAMINVEVAGQLPTRLDILNDPFLASPDASHIRFFIEYGSKNAVAAPAPPAPGFNKFSDLLTIAFQQAVLGRLSVKDALDQSVAAWNAEVRR